MSKKSYMSVSAMVKDTASPEFAKEFEEKLKTETVYIYVNLLENANVMAFSSLKLAKRCANIFSDKLAPLKWEKESSDIWCSKVTTSHDCAGCESVYIFKRKIVRI